MIIIMVLISVARVPGAPESNAKQTRNHWMPVVKAAAAHYEINWRLLDKVIWTESTWDPYALSPVGAEGLMQLIPSTAKMLGVDNSFDPGQAIWGGARYLAKLKRRFGSWHLALAAYNAGPTRVGRCNCVPDYPETRAYVKKILPEWKHKNKSKAVGDEKG